MIITSLITLWIAYCILFLLSIRLKDNSIADIFWGIGFMIILLVCIGFKNQLNPVQMIMSFLIVLWGVRLATHIFRKKWSHSGEDARYARWRETWKYFYIRSFLQVYLLQWFLMFLIATPIYIVFWYGWSEMSLWFTVLGTVMALFGFIYEVKADKQLEEFKKTKKKWEILTSWLRQYHRYPQYFGESLFWFGVCTIAAQYYIGAYIGWILITFLLLKVSGVPLLEQRYSWNKEYKKYSEHTPKFFPNIFSI